METYLNKLNEKQYDACIDTEGPSLIIAGAGSGKTRVLTTRIAYLINEKGVDPSEILAITFTNKAAKEMKDRLEKEVGPSAKFITCKTFHSFSAYVLRNDIEILKDRKRSFQIIDDDETEALVKKVMLDLNIDIKNTKPKTMANNISSIKSRICTLMDFKDFLRGMIENIMNAYNDELIKNNLLDFDDLAYLTTIIFEQYPTVLEKYQEKYRYILVDEFQDTSNIQYELVYLLGKKYQNVFIVGDEDQSIYSFRGANIKNIRKFMDDFRGYHQHVLDQNYRSSKPILDCANKLISHNQERIKKNLWSDSTREDEVELYQYDSDKAECRAIASIIKKGVANGEYEYKDYAIIYRNNHLSRNFENELIANRIPYKVFSGLSFYKRKEVKDMLSYLRLVINPEDFYSFKRVINSPKRGIGNTTLDKIENELDKLGKNGSVLQAIKNADIYQSVRETLIAFYDNISLLRNEFENNTLKDFFLLVYEKTEYKKFIDEIQDEDEREMRRSNIQELLSAISEVETIGSIEETLSDFLQNVSLLTDLDIEAADNNCVALITMHSAKGLEYKNVFAVALEDDVIPGQRNFMPSDLEEERRVLYVCLTRAMEHLYVSCATSRYKFGQMNTTFPSRFLKELGVKSKTEKDNPARNFQVNFGKEQKTVLVGEFNVGDKVMHEIYKKGTILGQAEGFYIIKFDLFPTPKKVIVSHPFLKKI